MSNKTINQRNSSFEVLRIISMLLIIAHHYACHAGFDFITPPFSKKLFFIECLFTGGKIGVNIFVLISGYFLCKTQFKIQKIIKLELQVLFYSISIGLLFYFFSPEKISFEELLKDFTPIKSDRYWFFTDYFFIFLLSPLLNIMINRINKDIFKYLLLAFSVLLIFIPLIQKSNELWFVFLYFIGAYIRFYPEDFKNSFIFYILLGIFSYIIIFVYIYVCGKFGCRSNFLTFGNYDDILIFICSIMFFIGFSKVNIGTIKIINFLASATFGVYLIHDNYLVRPFLWIDFFKNTTYINSKIIIAHAAFAIFSVYIVCSLIDLLRQLLEKTIIKFFSNGTMINKRSGQSIKNT